MRRKRPDVSVIIVHYKAKKELFNLLQSFKRSKPDVLAEIIVVDNDEKKGIKEKLLERFSNVIYVKSPKNIGFGAGCNLGAKYAIGEYLFFLNPDTELLPDTLDELYKFIVNKKSAGAVSPLLLDKDGQPSIVQGSKHHTIINTIFSLSFVHKLFPNNPIAKKFFLRDWDKRDIKRVDIVPGAAFLISKKLFHKIGGFDEKFFLYFEEADLARKISALKLNNYIVPQAKIIHLGGESTKKREDINEIFNKSKFYYFKKWHGLLSAIVVQVFTSVGKIHLLLMLILLAGFFLRIFKLNELMVFIGDQGWFYISARDMLLSGKIPLVGITSSHTWLHQGPFWTYIVAFLFWIFNFNPIAPAYFTAFLGTLTVWLIYKVSKELFSEKVGLISALLYATSPLIIANDRFAYHTSPIPFFILIFMFFVYKWVKGNSIFFALSIVSLGILYNFELATASLFGVLFIFLFSGVIRRKSWAVKIFNWKILLISILGFILSITPVIIYDFKNGFPQTLVFGGWIFYKIFKSVAGFSSLLFDSGLITSFLVSKYKLLVTPYDSIAFLTLLSSFIYFLFKVFTQNKEKASYFILLFVFLFPLLSIYLNKTDSDAYIPVLFPSITAISSVFFASLIKHLNILGKITLFVIIFLNLNFILKGDFFAKGLAFKDRENVVDKIITLTKDKRYNLIGKGEGSQFESFTMNYEFLLWRKGASPSKDKEDIKIYLYEDGDNVIIKKYD